jgi:hypothetical protein
VHKLWTCCRPKIFLRRVTPSFAGRPLCTPLSRRASLAYRSPAHTIHVAPDISHSVPDVKTAVHRFQESIGGHPYLIEVAAVTQNRWRACIVRLPGIPTALMPFYGPTPDEAAAQLREWLTRAHERAGRL